MEPESERAGAGVTPVGGAAEIREVADVGGVDGDSGIDPEQLEISVLEESGHRCGALAVVMRDGRVDDDADAAKRVCRV